MNDTPMVTLELPASTVARLRERADSAGLSLERYLDWVADYWEPNADRPHILDTNVSFAAADL
jgi:hypothetical protein